MIKEAKSYLLIALIVYCFLGALLIAQGPGLQYDEALLVSGAVHMRHSAGVFDLLVTRNSWVCPFDRCVPLMSAAYVGAVKDYAVLPFFAAFGPRVAFIRIVSLLLSSLCLWGVYRLVSEFFGARTGGMVALVLAVNPAFLYMAVFDNNAIGAAMAGFGLSCGCLAGYLRRRTFLSAFLLGLALGFTVWARANLVWVLGAGFLAGAICFRRDFLIPVRHWGAVLMGSIIGMFPFLVFQIVSNGGTWATQGQLALNTPLAVLLKQRIYWFADVLLSDGEHRQMWAGPGLPQWQLWLFPAMVFVACLLALLPHAQSDSRQRWFARAVSLAFLLTGMSLFFSRLPIAEHHLILLLPIAAAMVVISFSQVGRLVFARAAGWFLFAIYLSSAVYWQIAGIRGLGTTGGVGQWSNAEVQLADYLDHNLHGERALLLDWGLRYNLYVLTDGRVKSWEIYRGTSEQVDYEGRPWPTVLQNGGLFVVNGIENRAFSRPSAGFLHALAVNRPTVQTYHVNQRSGREYAQVINVAPNSVRGPAPGFGASAVDHIEMGDMRFDGRLSGFYPPEDGRYRWTKRDFSIRFDSSGLEKSGTQLVLRIYVPDIAIQKLKSVTLHATIGSQVLPSATWAQPGQYVYQCELHDLAPGPTQVNFSLSNAFSPSTQDHRELGIIVNEFSLEPI